MACLFGLGAARLRLLDAAVAVLAAFDGPGGAGETDGSEPIARALEHAVARARRLIRFLTQPFAVTSQFTGLAGASVSVEDTLAGCRAIMDGETDDWNEASLYMIGSLDEARQKEQTAATKGGPQS